MILTVPEASEELATMVHGEPGEDLLSLMRYVACVEDITSLLLRAIQSGKIRPRNRISGRYDDALAFMGKQASISLDDATEYLRSEGMQLSAPPSGAPENNTPRQPAPLQRQRHQDNEILRVIAELGYDAKALPKDTPGKPGVKAAVRDIVKFTSSSVFDKAWERLSASKEIIKLK